MPNLIARVETDQDLEDVHWNHKHEDLIKLESVAGWQITENTQCVDDGYRVPPPCVLLDGPAVEEANHRKDKGR
jgi:hypothetical protein